MADVEIIEGELFRDQRGRIASLNQFRFPGVERVYFLHHPDPGVIRGWNGHRFEKKWFYCVKGNFTIGLVKIDNWEKPSPDLRPQIVTLAEERSRIVCVPEGYANCIKAGVPDSVLMVFSGKILSEAADGGRRFDSKLWIDWSKL